MVGESAPGMVACTAALSLARSMDGPVSSIRLTGSGAADRRQRQHDERPAARQRRGGLQFARDPDPQRGQALLRR